MVVTGLLSVALGALVLEPLVLVGLEALLLVVLEALV